MEIDFSEIYKNCVFRSNFQLAVQTYIDMKEKNIDVTSYIKRGMAEEITKKIEEKIGIRLLNFKNEQDIDNWYEKWINNKTGIKYPLPNSKHPPKVQLESEFCIFTKKELYELLYSFNKFCRSVLFSAFKFSIDCCLSASKAAFSCAILTGSASAACAYS